MPKVFPRLEVEEQEDEGRRVDSSKLRKRDGEAVMETGIYLRIV